MSTSIQHRGPMSYFLLFDQDEQRRAIARLAASRVSDYTIAAATGLSVEMIRRILGEHRSHETKNQSEAVR
jgi:hypothetical protein